MLNTYGMVVIPFSVMDKANRVRFFEETFRVANVSLEIVFEMPFLTLSSTDVDFLGRKLRWRTYITKEALPTTRCVELVVKRRSLVPDLVTSYSRDAQREWMKLRRSREQKCGILKRCANDFSQRKRIQVT